MLGSATYLICNILLFAANILGQQNEQSPVPQGRFRGHGGVPGCGVTNPSPLPCVPIPRVLSATSPTYFEEARKAKIEGFYIVGLLVDEKGNTRYFRVIQPLGMGLDEKAIEAVKKWKFAPALKDGKPVPSKITVEVDFRL